MRNEKLWRIWNRFLCRGLCSDILASYFSFLKITVFVLWKRRKKKKNKAVPKMKVKVKVKVWEKFRHWEQILELVLRLVWIVKPWRSATERKKPRVFHGLRLERWRGTDFVKTTIFKGAFDLHYLSPSAFPDPGFSFFQRSLLWMKGFGILCTWNFLKKDIKIKKILDFCFFM